MSRLGAMKWGSADEAVVKELELKAMTRRTLKPPMLTRKSPRRMTAAAAFLMVDRRQGPVVLARAFQLDIFLIFSFRFNYVCLAFQFIEEVRQE